jgi:flagellar biosynthesis/type III secretory pathway protein FliH
MSSSSDVRSYGFARFGDETPRGTAHMETLMAEARANGHELGYQEERALEEHRDAAMRLAGLVDQVRVETAQFTRQLEGRLVDLVVAAAEKVIERELATDPSLVVRW